MLASIIFGACGVSLSVILFSRASFFCTAVWAQACGLEHKKSFVIIVHLWFIRLLPSFAVVVGVLVGAVSRYCHF